MKQPTLIREKTIYPVEVTPVIKDARYRYPVWVSKDGSIIYGAHGYNLIKSYDEWATYIVINAFPAVVVACRELDNGELLVSTVNGTGVPGAIWISSEGQTVWTKAQEATDDKARFQNNWGISVYRNIIVLGEYGDRGHANGVYLSKDYGVSFTKIFDISTVAADPPNAHIHAIAYDPYQERIWVANGDTAANKAIRYSDDWGETWITLSTDTQVVTIIPMKDCVLFGSDSSPNGLWRSVRTSKDKVPPLEMAYQLDNLPGISYITGTAYQKEGEPCYIAFKYQIGDSGNGFIVATIDGFEFYRIFTDWLSYPAGYGVTSVFGPTINNKLIGGINDTRQSSGSFFICDAPKIV